MQCLNAAKETIMAIQDLRNRIIWNLVKILIFNMFNCCELVVEVCTNNGIGKSTFLTDSG